MWGGGGGRGGAVVDAAGASAPVIAVCQRRVTSQF